ncbi:hypothetical protein [Krasilnikovia sp. MM14-A1259]|uniref:hypothetical protein n=1 Tax=Krasilnikovia sp. MM14-A1259 TaxID=3373539 RepID=UPI00399CF5E9
MTLLLQRLLTPATLPGAGQAGLSRRSALPQNPGEGRNPLTERPFPHTFGHDSSLEKMLPLPISSLALPGLPGRVDVFCGP